MRPLQSVSVHMPTWQGMEFLERVLSSLASQRLELPWDMYVIDSSSTDGTWELLERWRDKFPVPLGLERIAPVEFDHGDTRNLLAARTSGELLVFLTQDAIPSSPDWLERLVANFADERVGAANCRNIPREGCHPLTSILSRADLGYSAVRRETRLPATVDYAAMSAEERRVLYNFNDVASAVRRDLWEHHPFPRTAFGEDILMARALLEAGHTIVYDELATVEHSHDYTPEQTYERCRVDARFNAEWLDRTCVASEADADLLVERLSRTDLEGIRELQLPFMEEAALIQYARAMRRATFHGLYTGGLSEQRFPGTHLLKDVTLSILYVVHGFPPDTWAGTEIYTYNIAKELQRRGHRCTILTRVPADERELPDFHVEESEFQGLRVLRMTHRLQHANLRESYSQPKAESAFRILLQQERPDLVHFQHLIHTSVGLVDVARECSLPTVITCHDYWSVCPRVQLIRPDGVICNENQGSGCHLCIKDVGLRHIPRLHALDQSAGDLARGFALELLAGEQETLRTTAAEYLDLRDREGVVLAAYAAADLRISPSQFLRTKLLETGAFDPHTFLFSDNGMRTDHVEALEKTPDTRGRIRFGFVGSLVWFKGGEVMVAAMQRLQGQGCVLNVYGDFKPETEEHHADLERLAAGADVHFKGRFDNARLSEVYAEIDVLIVPSLWFENSPITIHEAYLTRTPVLASDIGGMAEFVRDGVDGLHYKVGDAEDLAAKMRRFVEEPDLLEQLSQNFMRIKTIEENAAETEFRYRGLVCREREAASFRVEINALRTSGRRGPVEEQAEGLLLLRPGAAVEYELPPTRPGDPAREAEVTILALGGESGVELSGRILLDGAEQAQITAFRAGAEDSEQRVLVALPRGARYLTVDTQVGPGGECAMLRLSGVVLRNQSGWGMEA